MSDFDKLAELVMEGARVTGTPVSEVRRLLATVGTVRPSPLSPPRDLPLEAAAERLSALLHETLSREQYTVGCGAVGLVVYLHEKAPHTPSDFEGYPVRWVATPRQQLN